LRSILGDEMYFTAYRTYIQQWRYKHPTPWDFFNTFKSVTGQNLDPFFQPWFFTRDKLDQAVTEVRQTGRRVTVTVANRGRLYAPIDVSATLADGKTVSWREPMSVWFTGLQQATTSHTVPGTVTRITLDEARDFPDVDRSNNTWTKR
jgi:aminopeptidase N